MNRKRIAVAAVTALVVLAAGAGVYLLGIRTVPAVVVEATRDSLPSHVSGPGTVQARIAVTLGSRITASVAAVHADVGDSVRHGAVLAELDDRDLAARRAVVGGQREALAGSVRAAQATVARASAELELARSKRRRDAELLSDGFVSKAAFDASDAALRAAEAGLENARALLVAREADARSLDQEARYSDTVLSYAQLVSPLDGIVVLRQAEVGTTVVAGSPVFRIVDPSTLWVATRIDESVVGQVRVGQVASIRLRTGDTVPGKVARIARQADAAAREMEVNVAFDATPASFAIDQEAEVAIVTGEESGVVVPVSALVRDRAGRQGVLAVVDSRTEFRAVTTGASDRGRVVVREGLASGERVVAPAAGIEPGTRVRPADGTD
ncbi:Multidrug resistance protein MdtA [Burkholderiales bacterium]|nr:Multidrug resistance protein MdtA [Burkholderiales bacterium]